MLQLRFRFGSRLPEIRDYSALPLEVSESADALLARAVVERIGFCLEVVDLALDRFRCVARIAEVELGESGRHLNGLAINGVGGFSDIRNYFALALCHRHDLALNLIAIRSHLVED